MTISSVPAADPTPDELELLGLIRRECDLVQLRNRLKEQFDIAEKEIRSGQDKQRLIRERLGYLGFGTV